MLWRDGLKVQINNLNTIYLFVLIKMCYCRCAAVVGFHPGRVDLYLSLPGCIKWGTIQHEFLHSLGFWHEHTRYDRDKYVSIQWENIEKGIILHCTGQYFSIFINVVNH